MDPFNITLKISSAVLMTVFSIWLIRSTDNRFSRKKPAKTPPSAIIKRRHDSLLVMFAVFFWTSGLLWKPSELLSSLGEWADTVVIGSLMLVFLIARLLFLLWDKAKLHEEENASMV